MVNAVVIRKVWGDVLSEIQDFMEDWRYKLTLILWLSAGLFISVVFLYWYWGILGLSPLPKYASYPAIALVAWSLLTIFAVGLSVVEEASVKPIDHIRFFYYYILLMVPIFLWKMGWLDDYRPHLFVAGFVIGIFLPHMIVSSSKVIGACRTRLKKA
jgi:hypothetical protein